MDALEIGAKIGIYFIPFLFALCFHEFAHGFVAKMRGDNTAQMMGRLTLNPISHMDLIGTLILPILAIVFASPIFFGWAKPVPVNPRNLKTPRTDMFWIALAGPLSNIFLAVVAIALARIALDLGLVNAHTKIFGTMLNVFVITNLFLAIFNLLPLNPLDGGKVIARFLPASLNYKLEQNEHLTGMLLMVLVLSGALKVLAIPVFWSHDFLMNTFLGGYL